MQQTWQAGRRLTVPLGVGLLVSPLSAGAVAQLLYDQSADVSRLLPVLGTTVPLAWRRHYPLAAYAIQFGAALLSRRVPTVAGLLAIFIGLYAVGASSRYRWWSL